MNDQVETKESESDEATENRRRKNRVSMLLLAKVYFDGIDQPTTTRILDLSSGGIRIGPSFYMDRGHKVRVVLKGVGEVRGKVAWARNGDIGIQFDGEIDPRLVGRALTGLPAATHIAFAKGPVPRPGFKVR